MKKNLIQSRVHTALAASCLAALTAFTASAQAKDLDIAVVGPITGPVAQFGDQVKDGIEVAAKAINDQGGVLGRKIKLVYIDDACEPKQAPAAANRVLNDKIQFVIGHVCSGTSVAASPIYEESGVLMITGGSTAPEVTEGKGYHYVFRTIGRTDQQAPIATKYIVEKLKPKKIAILHDKQTYGYGIASAMHDSLTKAGMKIQVYQSINLGEIDYSAVLTHLKSEGIDFVYFGGNHPEMGLLIRQAAEIGLKARFMGSEGVGNGEINAIAGDAVEGMLVTLPPDFAADPKNKAVVQAFADQKRDPTGAMTLTSYAAVQALAAAMTDTKSTDPANVAAWLRSHTVDSVIGPIAWDRQGDLKNFEFPVYVWHKDGSKTLAQ
ncbi:MAG: high-affinity branched-chain amino acid ABC transporter substrate-binding protein [Castellaniella sp.]|uniref:high-affinity branched-chain amino acid ABC transporter substrate-binding protein n=1 Tax=Castellaniella sp. TaxID=1955812 RepID=UPI003C787BC3